MLEQKTPYRTVCCLLEKTVLDTDACTAREPLVSSLGFRLAHRQRTSLIGPRCHDAQVNVRLLVGGLLVMLDLAVILLIGTQVASGKGASWNLVLPTVVFNIFGGLILWSAQDRDGR